jgi:transcriptional regulator with XRE-family HTH domain
MLASIHGIYRRLAFADSQIHEIETGKKQPTAELVVKVARLFGVTTDQLLLDELEIAGMTAPDSTPASPN